VTQHEYNQLRDQLERDYREKLHALDPIWSICRAVPGRNGHSQPQGAADLETENALNAAARKAIEDLPYFSIAEVDREMRKANPAMTVRRSLVQALIRRFVANGEVVLVEGRRGKPNAVYRRAESEKIELFKARAQNIIQNYPDLLNPIKVNT
jgi:hypothetical protein